MIEALTYSPGDLALVIADRPEIAPPCPVAQIEQALIAHGGWTLVVDGARVACAMLHRRWTGCASLVAFVGPIPRRRWPRVRVLCRDVLARWMEDGGQYRRIDATVRCDAPGHVAFIRSLGFELEGRMCGYGPDGADYWMAARVRLDGGAAS